MKSVTLIDTASHIPAHVAWFKNTKTSAQTADGFFAEIWEFQHTNDERVLKEWASHFRNHYCLDNQIDQMRGPKSRLDYLVDLKFPTKTGGLGPATRAGDFGEILIADFLSWILGYWVPRVRWESKIIQNESPKGSDVIGFHLEKEGEFSIDDKLLVFESKTKFSNSATNVVQSAINDSAKDHIRLAESLNFIKQKLLWRGESEKCSIIERFQSPVDQPYGSNFGAAAIVSTDCFNQDDILIADTSSHPHGKQLKIVVVRGAEMMPLVHKLYEIAANEA